MSFFKKKKRPSIYVRFVPLAESPLEVQAYVAELADQFDAILYCTTGKQLCHLYAAHFLGASECSLALFEENQHDRYWHGSTLESTALRSELSKILHHMQATGMQQMKIT